MNIILSTVLPGVPYHFVRYFYPRALHIKNIFQLEQIERSIPSVAQIVIVDDISFNMKDVFAMINRVKKREENNKVPRFILLASSLPTERYRSMIIMGFDWVVPADLSQLDKVAQKIIEFIEKNCTQSDKREFIRVKPDEKDRLFIEIAYPDANHTYLGKITDISMGGAAVYFEKELPDENIDIIPNSKINIKDIQLPVTLKLVKKTNGFGAFRFATVPNITKECLAEYIFLKTQNESL